MKKKKVDKIIKGVVTAGVALGGASYMTEADMVYAAEMDENNEEQPAAEEVLENDEVASEEEQNQDQLDNNPPAAEEPAAEAPSEESAPDEEKTPQEEKKTEQAEKKIEQAEKKIEQAEKKFEQAEKKMEQAEKKAAKADAPAADTPTTDAPAADAPAADTPAADAPAADAPAADTPAADAPAADTPAADAPAADAPAAPENAESDTGSENPSNPVKDSDEYKAVYAGLEEKHNTIVTNEGAKSWSELQAYLADYVRADLLLQGATNIKFSSWQKVSGNNHYIVNYWNADGDYCTSYYGYVIDGSGTKGDIIIQEKHPTQDENGKLVFDSSTDTTTKVVIKGEEKTDLGEAFDKKADDYSDEVANGIDKSDSRFIAYQEFLEAQAAAEKGNPTWNKLRPVVIAYAKMQILLEGGTDVNYVKWVGSTPSGPDYHYGLLTYTDKEGAQQSAYYDYATLDKNGNWDSENPSKDLVILKKTPNTDENGKVILKANKDIDFQVAEDTGSVKGTEVYRIMAGTGSQISKLMNDFGDKVKDAIKGVETPAEEPVAPAEEPTTPADGPVAPAEEPTTPADGPVAPADEPTTPADGPVAPAEEPTTPADGPITPADEPTTPAEEPTAPAEKPETPSTPGTSGTTTADTPATPATTTTDDTAAPAATTDTPAAPATTEETPATGTAPAAAATTGRTATTTRSTASTTSNTNTSQSTSIEDNDVPATDNAQNAGSESVAAQPDTGAGQSAATGNGGEVQAQDAGSVNIGNGEVPLGLKTDGEEIHKVTLTENQAPKTSAVDVKAPKGLWAWILALIAAITGKTEYDKEHKKGIFKNTDKK